MSLSSSKDESYKQFKSIREKFSSPSSFSSKSTTMVTVAHTEKQRNIPHKPRRPAYDPRASAPPLLPLVEEGDQMQNETNLMDKLERLQPVRQSVVGSNLVKGRIMQNHVFKSNHLNGPDFDALETASVTSCSSAYSSRSESSILSPFTPGSVTELSDAGSGDTFYEYDPKPDDTVTRSRKLWDKVLGEWKFNGIVHLPSSPCQPQWRPSNEIRVPTPLGSTYTPDSGSRTSLLSYADESHDTTQELRDIFPSVKHTMGKFLRPESNKATKHISAYSAPATPCTSLADQPSKKWQDTLARFNKRAQASTETKEIEDKDNSIIECRAEKFGGTKKRTLRRAQSFQVGPRETAASSYKNTKHRLY